MLTSAENSLRANGKFVTSADESGVYLMWPDGQGLKNKDGTRAIFKFADMNSGKIATEEEYGKLKYVLDAIKNDPQSAIPGGVMSAMPRLINDRGLLETYFQKYKAKDAAK
jgi:hypothetical protein